MDFLVAVLNVLCLFLLGWVIGWFVDLIAYVDIKWGRYPDDSNYKYVYVCLPLFGRWRYFCFTFMDGKRVC